MAIAKTWNHIKNSSWLVLATLSLGVALFFWIMLWVKSGAKEEIIEQKQQQVDMPHRFQVDSISFAKAIGNFDTEVPALDSIRRTVTVGSHEPEFKGIAFIQEYKNAWTLQVMQVTDEDIIRVYLAKRDDRDQFQYFRIAGADGQERFVLTYGVFKTTQDVSKVTERMDFNVPATVQVQPIRFSSFLDQVQDIGDESTDTPAKLRQVVLSRVAIPKYVPPPPPVLPKPDVDSTLIQRNSTGVASGNDVTMVRKEAGSTESEQKTATAPKYSNEGAASKESATVKTKQSGPQGSGQVSDPF